MEDHKKHAAAAKAVIAGCIDESGGITYNYAGDISEIIGIAMTIIAGAAAESLETEALHKLADELKGLFLQACVMVTVETEGGGIFGNDHFTN